MKSFLLCLALFAWLGGHSALSQESLDFTDIDGRTLGIGPATGHLNLAFPLNVLQSPLPGSVFDPDGPGPLPEFDLTAPQIHWVGEIQRVGIRTRTNALEGQFQGGIGLQFGEPNAHFTTPLGQFYIFALPTYPFQKEGIGFWSVATTPSTPDAAPTAMLLPISLAALAMAARRLRNPGPLTCSGWARVTTARKMVFLEC